MNNSIVRSFNNSNIRFEKRGEHTWVCLTDMAKASGKEVKHYRENKSARELEEAMNETVGIPTVNSVEGRGHGTWAIEEIALDFAGWCSVQFKIWMLQQIKTLMSEGTVTLRSTQPDTEIELSCRVLELIYKDVLKPTEIAGLKASYIARTLPALKPELESTQSLLAHSNVTPLLLGAKQLGLRLGGISAIKANKLLLAAGLQVKNESKASKSDPDYLPTEEGKEYSEFTTSTQINSSCHHQQLKWHESVLPLLEAELY